MVHNVLIVANELKGMLYLKRRQFKDLVIKLSIPRGSDKVVRRLRGLPVPHPRYNVPRGVKFRNGTLAFAAKRTRPAHGGKALIFQNKNFPVIGNDFRGNFFITWPGNNVNHERHQRKGSGRGWKHQKEKEQPVLNIIVRSAAQDY